MSPSDVHSATSSISYLLGWIGVSGLLQIGIIWLHDRRRVKREGKKEGAMAEKIKTLETERIADRRIMENYGKALERIANEIGALGRQFAAFSGVANGIDYRKEGG